ncbi:MAG: hypothetical protein ACRCUX_07020 [Beijerinckiaceae bacterium]
MPRLQPVHYLFLGWCVALGIVCAYLQARFPAFRDGVLPPLVYIFIGLAVGEGLLLLSGRGSGSVGGAVPMPVRMVGLALAACLLLLSPSLFG